MKGGCLLACLEKEKSKTSKVLLLRQLGRKTGEEPKLLFSPFSNSVAPVLINKPPET